MKEHLESLIKGSLIIGTTIAGGVATAYLGKSYLSSSLSMNIGLGVFGGMSLGIILCDVYDSLRKR